MIEYIDIEGRLYPAIKLNNGKYLICGEEEPPEHEEVLSRNKGEYLIYVMIEDGTCGIINRAEEIKKPHIVICTKDKKESRIIDGEDNIDKINENLKKEFQIEDIIDANSYIGYDDNNDNNTITDIDLKILIIDNKCYKVVHKEKNTIIVTSYENKIS